MNVLFLAENPRLFLEYALRLEENNIPFWTANSNNDFHRMMTQVKLSLVFADYNFMDFKKFDVYKHIAKNRKDLVFLFLNEPGGKGDLLVQWEDKIKENFPNQWTRELEKVLRIVTGQEIPEDFSCKPARVQDLVGQIGGDDKEPVQEISGKGIEEKFGQARRTPARNGESLVELQSDASGLQVFENGSLEEFMDLHRKYKVGYQEYILLNLFFRRLNQFVELEEMLQVLDAPKGKKGVNAVYQCIYRIRIALEKMGKDQVQLIRVKKGCYSLVSPVPQFHG